MAEFETPPSFSGVRYDVPPMNIGQGYAEGIGQAGKAIAGAVSEIGNIAYQNRTADDTLSALHQTGVLSPQAYQAVAGKSLGAKQTILGMYASQWINDQAQLRELQKVGYAGAVDVARQKEIQHNAILEAYQAIKGGYPQAAGLNTKNLLAQPQGQSQQPGPPQPIVAPLIGPRGALPTPTGVTPQITQQAQQMAGTPTAPTPMGSGNIYAPGPKLGTPITRDAKIPPGSTVVQGTGPQGQIQHFVKLPDGTLQPIQG